MASDAGATAYPPGGDETIVLTELESKQLVRQAGIAVVDTRLARDGEEAVAAAVGLGFPVAMKIASRDIVHKSDVGGVALGLADASQVARAYSSMMAEVGRNAPGAGIDGVTVQPMARPATELIVGVSQDPQFGPRRIVGGHGIDCTVRR
jgi:acyl-CoA synthetase (NDP forming)